MQKATYFLGLIAILFISSCGGKENNEQSDSLDTKDTLSKADSLQKILDDEKEFKFFTIIANIPSPAHEVIVISKSGYKYDPTFLNPKENVDKYSTTFKTAANYGVYSADLAYIASFNNNSDVLKYFSVTRKAAEKAGALTVFDDITKAGHFEEMTKISDSLEAILDRVYTSTDKFLQNDHNLDIATDILIGSWVESQYLVLSSLNGAKGKDIEPLKKSVWESKLHLSNILDLLKEYQNDADLTALSAELSNYMKNYEGISDTKQFTKEKLSKMGEEMKAIRTKIIS